MLFKNDLLKARKLCAELQHLLLNNSFHNKDMSTISLKARKLLPKVKNGMKSSDIHAIRSLLATIAETASHGLPVIGYH